MLPPLAAPARLFGVRPYHAFAGVEHRTDISVSARMVIDTFEAVQLSRLPNSAPCPAPWV
jgi:hypothetical protein